MTLRLLVVGACALGSAALAQQGSGSSYPANQGTTGTSPNDMPSGASGTGSNSGSGSNSTYGSGSNTSAPNRNLTRSQKKESLDRVKKAIRDAASGAGQESGAAGGTMSGQDRGTMGRGGGESGAMSGSSMGGGVQHLKVTRRGDKIVIRGTVSSQEEKDRLGSVANEAAQGEQIVNELKVK